MAQTSFRVRAACRGGTWHAWATSCPRQVSWQNRADSDNVSLQVRSTNETLGSWFCSQSAPPASVYPSYLPGRNVGPFQTRTRKVKRAGSSGPQSDRSRHMGSKLYVGNLS